MTLEQKIRLAITHRRTTQTAVARAIGMSRQNFHHKLKNGSFTLGELERIAQALDARFQVFFRLPDGSRL